MTTQHDNKPAVKQATNRQVSIMVIDDNIANLNYLADTLIAQEYRVRAFLNGRQAILSAEQSPPDLILLDINMPELNGFEVCVLLKSHAELKDIPVIFLSAISDTQEKVRAFQCGGVDYISKPFEIDEIKARIRTHLNLARSELLEKEMQKRLETERRYYEQLDNLADAIIHSNQAGKIVYCNPVVEQYFGYKPDELLGQDIDVLLPVQCRQNHQRYRQEYMQSPGIRPMSMVKNIFALHKSGTQLPVDISLSTLYSNDGLLVSAEIRDISEQVKLRHDLEIQQQLFSDALSKTPDGIVLTDASGRILQSNPSILRMCGYSEEEFTRLDIKELFNGDDEFAKITSLNGQGNGDSTEKDLTVCCRRRDGTTFPAEISVVPVRDHSGQQHGFFNILRDISERLHLEQKHKLMTKQLMQAQKMEALGQLTGGVAHDFNNILASIMGFAELADNLVEEEAQYGGSGFHTELKDYLGEILIASERAKSLIEQMLTFSRSGASDALISTNLSSSVHEAVKMMRPVFPTTIRINAAVHDNSMAVLANPVQMHQVLLNVCINARDAMAGKGRIDISLHEVKLQNCFCASCQQPVTGGYVDLAIKDSGPGIDAALMERLFEPFFTTKTPGKGSGMGLPMVHGIMHHHSGHILVESEPGQGSTFHLLLPVTREKSDVKKPAKQAAKEPA